MAMTIFMGTIPPLARPAGAGSGGLDSASPREVSAPAGNAGAKESNPVPSPVIGLKALEMKGFLTGQEVPGGEASGGKAQTRRDCIFFNQYGKILSQSHRRRWPGGPHPQ
jgi:hypothetical protein